ncbi:MAG: FGGY-family carbohydrate kinase [Clostridiales bacterium]|nr:FGGY-family carbohydrate kinase [Clostridiales bacterium]
MGRDIAEGRTALGIELGSTRIKASLIGGGHAQIASGSHDWENRLEGGIWTYPLEEVWSGLRSSFAALAADVRRRYGVELESTGAIGISAMMHGYLVFGRDGRQLVPFRTWRNTTTERAAALLTEALGFNMPQRWSAAHLYQAILDGEPHVSGIAYMTTLAGYVHWALTGEKALGVGDASGMFPIDSAARDFDARMLGVFDGMAAAGNPGWRLREILPKVLSAGDAAGTLTPEGAALLDPSGRLRPGIPLCPPEGDAGTGMVATNSVAERTGNVSAGTSIFAMFVLEKPLSKVHTEIDMVTTPSGKPVAMAHCNNCTTDLDAWFRLFGEVAALFGAGAEKPALYDALYNAALEGDPDCGGLLAYNYYSGEPITGLELGRPLLARLPDSKLTVANMVRALLYSAMATLKLGMDILTEKERVAIDRLYGHGGLFKTKGVGQRLMAAALNVPVAVMDSAGEGGAWGIALLAAYMRNRRDGEPLEAYLAGRVFAGAAAEAGLDDGAGAKAAAGAAGLGGAGAKLAEAVAGAGLGAAGASAVPKAQPDAAGGADGGTSVALPDERDKAGFAAFMRRYVDGLAIERAAAERLK